MSNQNASSSMSLGIVNGPEAMVLDRAVSYPLPESSNGNDSRGSSFWHDRLVEGGLIFSMALYYIVGNINIHPGLLPYLNPLATLPFLLVFAVLAWYRLPFAVALLPLSLPFYLLQKTVIGHEKFSLVEVTLATCLAIALLQFLLKRRNWQSKVSWSELRDRLGPFLYPLIIFFLAAAFSIVVAYSRVTALRAFHEEVLGPLLYLILILVVLRSRQDVTRLLGALIGAGLLITILGLVQYFFFWQTILPEVDGVRRIAAVYGSANSIGLLFDYVFPIGLALLLGKVSWKIRLVMLALSIPMLFVLYLSQSYGARIGIAIATLFILAFSIRRRHFFIGRKVLALGGIVVVVVSSLVLIAFHTQVYSFFLEGHTSLQGQSTIAKRFYLWESALHMIHDRPVFGYGMDNWLCYYSKNTICPTHVQHYWITNDPPVTGPATGLKDEPNLSHPHNIFLHIWVSMGVFGVLAFVVVLVLFYWLFGRILSHLRLTEVNGSNHLRWMTIGVGAAMLAALVQGQGDSAFLEQDLAFCFWTLVAALLVLRMLSGLSWKDVFSKRYGTSA